MHVTVTVMRVEEFLGNTVNSLAVEQTTFIRVLVVDICSEVI